MASSPFDSGKTLVFKAFAAKPGDKCYLDAWALTRNRTTVYLSKSLDFVTNMGCHWEVKKVADGSGAYTLKTMSAGNDKPCYLADLGGRSPDLSNNPGDVNCHWRFSQLMNGSYTLQSASTDQWLDSRPEDGTVFFQHFAAAVTIGSWKVGVDFYTGQEVKSIINQTYPSLNVQYYADLHYMALDMEDIHAIWNESKLDQSKWDSYRWKHERFDCDDFAICLKAQVAKYSYNQSVGKGGSLCGIVWGENNKSAHAFNFTVDRFGKLILFEPQTGSTIDTNTWNPYFCMV